ncbi:MAG: isochorismatase family protein, partial [Pseudomonadota bacterium]
MSTLISPSFGSTLGWNAAPSDPEVEPKEGEIKVLKHNVNAFRETNLKALLDENNITDVTIVGD